MGFGRRGRLGFGNPPPIPPDPGRAPPLSPFGDSANKSPARRPFRCYFPLVTPIAISPRPGVSKWYPADFWIDLFFLRAAIPRI